MLLQCGGCASLAFPTREQRIEMFATYAVAGWGILICAIGTTIAGVVIGWGSQLRGMLALSLSAMACILLALLLFGFGALGLWATLTSGAAAQTPGVEPFGNTPGSTNNNMNAAMAQLAGMSGGDDMVASMTIMAILDEVGKESTDSDVAVAVMASGRGAHIEMIRTRLDIQKRLTELSLLERDN